MPKLRTGSWRRDRKRGNRAIVPTSMLTQGTKQIYVQGGHFYTGGGVHLPTPPDWAVDILKAMTKERQDELGFETKFGKLRPKGGAAVKSEPKEKEPEEPDEELNEDDDPPEDEDEDENE